MVSRRNAFFKRGFTQARSLDMLFAKIVQHPNAHLSRIGHRKGGNRHRVKGRTEPLFRLQPQNRRPTGRCSLSFLHIYHPRS